jgi:rifampicin phosphotransferase
MVSDLIVSLVDSRGLDSERTGRKAFNIAEMSTAGFAVPRAFCITTAAYRRQVKNTPIERQLDTLTGDRALTVEHLSESLHALFLSVPLLSEVEGGIRAAYRSLGRDAQVAVRSSATAEDLPNASFAGQQESFLGVQGEHGLLDAVRRCWASLWTARAIHYRRRQHIPDSSVAMAVVVQEMIWPDAAGVMFTANPVTGSNQEVTITATYGLGDVVVSGLVTPDTYVVATRTMAITRMNIGTKQNKVVQQEKGTRLVPVVAADQNRPCLSDAMVLEVARVGLAVERHFGRPQDIEWAVADDRVHLLQTRPVTTLDHATSAHELPGCAEAVYGWIYLGRLPRVARGSFLRMARDHFPQPLRPFDIHNTLVPALAGARRVAQDLGIHLPVEVVRLHASGLVLFNPPVPAILRTAFRLPAGWRVLQVWARYEPLREWQEVDEPYLRTLLPSAAVDTMSSTELVAAIRQLHGIITELMYRRFRKYMAAGAAANRRLNTLLRSAFGKDADDVKRRLMLNVGHVTAASNRAMVALAKSAAANVTVREILATHPYGARHAGIVADPRCQHFAERLEDFLAQYGFRTAVTMEPQPSYPAWRDEPDQVLSLIGTMVKKPDLLATDPLEEERTCKEARLEMNRGLQGTPSRQAEFDRALDTARGFVVAREASLYFLEEVVGLVRIRADLLAGHLVADGRLSAPRLIYYLAPDELEGVLSGQLESNIDEMARHRRMVWKRMRDMSSRTSVPESRNRSSLRGTPVSSGVAIGTARIIRGAHDFEKLMPGDILVCPSTTPAWTPLFTVAAAVVADVGGVLSHAAIVAREQRIPAVMACSDATQTIEDGEQIEVNGTTGFVRRLSRVQQCSRTIRNSHAGALVW